MVLVHDFRLPQIDLRHQGAVFPSSLRLSKTTVLSNLPRVSNMKQFSGLLAF